MSFFVEDILNQVLDEFWGSGTPPIWYIALFEVLPAADGTGGTEATFTGYVRQASSNDGTEWPPAAAGLKSNASIVDYGVAGSGPTDVVGFGFYDDPTAGDLYAVIDLTGAPVTINNGANVSFPVGAIDLTGCV